MPFKKYNNPDELKSKYVHEHRDNYDEAQKRYGEYNNRNFLRTFDMDQISKVWDSIIEKRLVKR